MADAFEQADAEDEEMLALLIAEVDQEETLEASPVNSVQTAPKKSAVPTKIKKKAEIKSGRNQDASTSRAAFMKKTSRVKTDDFMDKHAKLRIKNRLVGAEAMDEHMKGRTTYLIPKLANIPQWKLEDETQDWVTFGVLMNKSPSKSASNGGKYMIWKLSDLEGSSISIFLFRDAYDTHWKESEGTVIAVLNSKVVPAKDNQRSFSLSVSEAGEIAKLGTSMDYGFCKVGRGCIIPQLPCIISSLFVCNCCRR